MLQLVLIPLHALPGCGCAVEGMAGPSGLITPCHHRGLWVV